ncbi:EamA family transporter [Pseudomonas floridensis]|uniref:EamA family transporter n=1 Tax=Pseudomonas floridensis TaxID=1958950 RepID=A0A1X0MZ62_9PSED|nr:DMT family transporter [Pseudomonas floridensis]ORC55158.1 EamA family transporter [Pseudomonas floridensis]
MNGAYLGALSMAIYCLSTALSAVWVMFSFTRINGATLTFITFLLAWSVFFVVHRLRGHDPLRLLKDKWRAVTLLNVLTLFSWWFMFMALQRIEASVESAIYQGWMPLVVVVCEALTGKSRVSRFRWLGALMILVSLLGLVMVRLALGATAMVSVEHLYEGIALATVAGITGGIYIYSSGRLNLNQQYSAMDILCVRFFLLLLVTGWIGRDKLLQVLTLDTHMLFQLMGLAVFSVLIPVFSLQYAIQRLGGGRVSILTPCVPVIALAAEFFLSAWHTLWVPFLVTMVCVAVILSNVWFTRNVRLGLPVQSPATLPK